MQKYADVAFRESDVDVTDGISEGPGQEAIVPLLGLDDPALFEKSGGPCPQADPAEVRYVPLGIRAAQCLPLRLIPPPQ